MLDVLTSIDIIIAVRKLFTEMTMSIDTKKSNGPALGHLDVYGMYLVCITLALPCCAAQLLNAASKRLTNSSHMLDK